MAKRKPCKPKPKIDWDGSVSFDHERGVITWENASCITELHINPIQVLTPVHIK